MGFAARCASLTTGGQRARSESAHEGSSRKRAGSGSGGSRSQPLTESPRIRERSISEGGWRAQLVGAQVESNEPRKDGCRQPSFLGLPMKWVSLLMLVAQTVGVVFAMR